MLFSPSPEFDDIIQSWEGLCEAVCKKNVKIDPHQHVPALPRQAEQERPAYEVIGLRLLSGVARSS